MYFMHNQGWSCQFLEPDLKTPLPRKLTFATSDKVLQLIERAGALKDLAARQAIEHGIEMGRGGVYLMLTPEQYGKLKGR
jgi:2-polyprenyl-6-methoxyphenol hydroxylase-like FAD-dependent oxidoreductase